MAHETKLLTLVQIPIGWCAKMGVTIIRIRARKMVILESTLVDYGSGDF